MIENTHVLTRAVAAALAGSTMLAVVPTVASAQEAATRSPSVLEEIVVTAQRRAQVLQEVPITVQVVNQDLIDDVAAEDMSDLNGFVPGLVVSGDSPTQPRYQIRGIQTGDFGVGTDPAVGVYVDGVYAARSGASLLAFNDIERIEVLKGPQGTLFGRNSAAGAVSIVTRQPVDEFDALLKLRAGEYDKHRAEGMVNVPVVDGLSLRVNGVWNESDGWIEDAATGKDLYPEDNWAVRAALKWTISQRTSATLTWDHDEVDQLARPAIGLVPLSDGEARGPYPAEPDTFLDPVDAPVYNDVVGNEESRDLDGLTLFIDHDFGWSDFRSTTSYREFQTVNREDEDGTNHLELYFDTANLEDNESFYQEFKWSGQTGSFDWVAGASYYEEDARQASDTHAYTDSIDTVLVNLGVLPPEASPDGTLFNITSIMLEPIGVSLLGLPWRETMYNEGTFEAAALFGDVIWHATDRLNVTFGLRYTHDEKEFSWFNGPRVAAELDDTLAMLGGLGLLNPADYQFDIVFDQTLRDEAGNPVGTLEGRKVELDDSWDDLSPRIVLDYEVAPHVMVFGSLAKGYKAGGYNSVEVGSRFENEDVWNLEGGVKSLFTDLDLLLNASTFYYVYYDKQAISLVSGVSGSGVPQYVVDTSDEEAWGIEVDARWQPLEALTLSANLAFIDATYKDKKTRSGVDLSGEPTGEPYFSAAFGASYAWSLGNHGLLDFSAMHAYRGESRCNAESRNQGDCQVSRNFEVGEATNRTDVRLAWSSYDDAWGVAAFVTNVFDDQYVTGVNNLTRDTFGTPFASISEPRQWGVELRRSF
ncbi:MAG TPA: TonB-dependent receptor [Steroidobacteraceae bacterium]|nr:TonB-dependent receptor [Steroidobacteraceae bacterium]